MAIYGIFMLLYHIWALISLMMTSKMLEVAEMEFDPVKTVPEEEALNSSTQVIVQLDSMTWKKKLNFVL